MLEAYTTLGFLAQATERIALGPMVGNAVLRTPGLLREGRDDAGRARRRPRDLFRGRRRLVRARIGRAGVAVAAARPAVRAARGDAADRAGRCSPATERRSTGRHHRLAEPINVPPPLSRPRIMVGGGGERKTLRLVAEYADACNILVPDPGESRHKLEVLARHCEAIGRDFAEIETTALLEADLRPGRQTPADVIAAFRAQADEGIEHVIVNLPDAHLARAARDLRARRSSRPSPRSPTERPPPRVSQRPEPLGPRLQVSFHDPTRHGDERPTVEGRREPRDDDMRGLRARRLERCMPRGADFMSAEAHSPCGRVEAVGVVKPSVACTVMVLFDGLVAPFGYCSCGPGCRTRDSTTYVALSFVVKSARPPVPKPFRSRLLVPWQAATGSCFRQSRCRCR